MWPAAYWIRWSDYIIHRIHGRVLTHGQGLTEARAAAEVAPAALVGWLAVQDGAHPGRRDMGKVAVSCPARSEATRV
jgi:hypothetical protein